MATRSAIFRMLCEAASPLYGDAEARTIAEIILRDICAVTRNELLVEPNLELPFADLERVVADIKAWRPVQYITGRVEFFDMALDVAEGVLIPRPETEELVSWVASEATRGSRIVDMCTGSGCIALALARSVAGSSVVGVDISADALNIARRNGERYAPHVEFIEGDVLSDVSQLIPYNVDIIISNPPYIPVSDRASMRRNVTEYEPDIALFVPDDDPLLFYRSIAHAGRDMLSAGGSLYFEIYESLADDMCRMLADEGYVDIRLRHDFLDKPRMICARRE